MAASPPVLFCPFSLTPRRSRSWSLLSSQRAWLASRTGFRFAAGLPVIIPFFFSPGEKGLEHHQALFNVAGRQYRIGYRRYSARSTGVTSARAGFLPRPSSQAQSFLGQTWR